jgi:kinesin family member 11
MTADMQSDYRHLQRGIASTSRNVDTVLGQIISEVSLHSPLVYIHVLISMHQGNGLANSSDAYFKATTTGLSSMTDASRTMVEQGAQEDVSTGTTPRKRAFEVKDHWPLTKSRDSILRASNQRIVPTGVTDASPVVERAIPYVDTVHGVDRAIPYVNTVHGVERAIPDVDTVHGVFTPGVDEVNGPETSLPPSLSSSVSSCHETPRPLIPPPTITLQKAIRGSQKQGLPAMGTLTERSTNIITKRRSRRVR